MFALALTTLLLCPQDPAQKPKADVKYKVWDDKQAKAAIAVFREASKKKRGQKKLTMARRMENVEALAKGQNKLLVRPLSQVVTRDRAITIQRAAAKSLAHQPEKTAHAAIIKLLSTKDYRLKPEVQAELVLALDTAGYKAKDWKLLKKLFGTDFAEKRVRLQQNILILVKHHKEIQALNLLCEHVGEPGQDIGDVDAASNPPAEYWKARWHAWRAWRNDVKAALLEITGQRFSTKKEAKTWIKKNRKKLR